MLSDCGVCACLCVLVVVCVGVCLQRGDEDGDRHHSEGHLQGRGGAHTARYTPHRSHQAHYMDRGTGGGGQALMLISLCVFVPF